MIVQYQTIQFTLHRGPGTLLRAVKGVSFHVMVYRPISIWANTLMTHPTTINHNNQNPASAPTFVVAINSPDPTIDPAIIIPGPSLRSVADKVRGGDWAADKVSGFGFWVSGCWILMISDAASFLEL